MIDHVRELIVVVEVGVVGSQYNGGPFGVDSLLGFNGFFAGFSQVTRDGFSHASATE